MSSNPSEWTTMTILSAFTWLVSILVSIFIITISWLRPSYLGWRGWAVGQTALVLGVLVGSLRTPDNMLFTVMMANTLIMAGSTLCLRAFQRFSGQFVSLRTARWGWAVCLTLIVALVLLTTVWDNIALRFVLVMGYVSISFLRLVALMVGQMRQHPALRTAYGLNLGVLLGSVLLTLPHSRMMISVDANLGSILNVPNVLLQGAALLLSVGGSFAFWLLHDDRRRQEVQRLHDELLVQATLDPLTLLLNRRGLAQAYGLWGDRDKTAEAELLLLDINEFKGINDQHGHAEGDRCLVRLAETLRTITHCGDLVSRVGGDEFVVLLSGPKEQVTQQIKALKGHLAKDQQGTLGFTVSLGSTRVVAGEDLAKAMNRADQGMYRDKARGIDIQQPRRSNDA